MLPVLLALTLSAPSDFIQRDAFGVPHVRASSWSQAFHWAGYAVAQDRLWQMETSRRVARGRMAEVFGPSAVASDRDVLRFGYTDEELLAQFRALPESIRTAFESYAAGVNAWVQEAKSAATLPEGYAKAGFQPEPWEPVDSVAIAVRLFQLFGRRDPGELRNLGLLMLLPAKERQKALDVFDDLVWLDDPASPTTVRPEDDLPPQGRPNFTFPTRAQTEAQLEALPKLGLLDLLPAIRMAEARPSARLAMEFAAPYRAGSYAIVIGKERSATGWPILLSAPQMGFTNPSIVHEMSIEAPGIKAVGMDVPGVPGIVIGHTDRLAWALTSGVADTDDTFCFRSEGAEAYRFGENRKAIQIQERTLRVAGREPEQVERQMTEWGPVILNAKGHLFVRRSASFGRELQSMEALYGLYVAERATQLEAPLSRATVNFNFLFAFRDGTIGYRYLGAIPKRAAGLDPRLPAMGSPATDWQGFIPFDQMPRVDNPKSGLLLNWNNKPASWFPHGDTPVWGRLYKLGTLSEPLAGTKLTVTDVEFAAWSIARADVLMPFRTEYLVPALMPKVRAALKGAKFEGMEADAAAILTSYDGRCLEGSQGAELFSAFVDALREQTFAPTTGIILSPQTFRMAIQGTPLIAALEGKTGVPYLNGRKRDEVILAAFRKAVANLAATKGNDPLLWRYSGGGIPVSDEPPIPYGNRGTYIQIVELNRSPRGRNVLPPGVAEAGPHAKDQAPLARAWTYKPMRFWE